MPVDSQVIVTLESFPDGKGGLERRPASSAMERILEARHDEILRRVEEATEEAGSSRVMVTVQNREVSLKVEAPSNTGDVFAHEPCSPVCFG